MQTKMASSGGTRAPAAKNKSGLMGYLSLFTSLGTLLCCALPSLLVLLGLGATVAAGLSAAPWLVTLSHYRDWVFLIAGLLIGTNFFYVYRWAPRLKATAETCDPAVGPNACADASRLSRVLLWTAAVIYAIGFSTAFILAPILGRLAA